MAPHLKSFSNNTYPNSLTEHHTTLLTYSPKTDKITPLQYLDNKSFTHNLSDFILNLVQIYSYFRIKFISLCL